MTRRPARAVGYGPPARSRRSIGAARAGAGVVPALVVAVAAGLSPFAAAGATTATQRVPVSAAMAGTEDYCAGYEQTFHGKWTPVEAGTLGPPVLFRIGVNSRGKGCYAQLNVMTPPGVAPFELPRFRADAGDDIWRLHYRGTVLEIDTARGTAVRRLGEEPPQSGTLLAHPPPVGEAPPPPTARQRARWYGKWRGRLSRLPFPVTLRFAESGTGEVVGRISSLLMRQTFRGRFHGEMLVFRWRNRHVGLVMEPGGDTLVYHDYRGRVHRFRRRR